MTTTANGGTTLTHIRLTEPALTFDPVDAAQQHLNPLAGLAAFGPYSAAAWEADHQRVRVAILAPHDAIDPIRGLLNELRDSAEPRERRDYLPPYPGFKSAFRAALVPAEEAARQPLPEDLDRKMAASAEPHMILARALTEGLGRLAAVRSLFDVVVFYLPQRWEPRFVVGEFDLHDHVKAAGARLGLPTQIVTDLAMSYHCRASVGWRLATALYAKAGGIPYKLATGGMMDPGTAYVGLAYGIRDSGRPANSFVVCCSQLFDGQGGGLEFVAHDVSGDVDPRNPYLTRPQMRSILSRSLNIYADRHAGQRPSHLVVHEAYPFTDEESKGAAEAWGRGDELTCVSLTKPAWRGVQVTAAKDARTGGPRYGYAVDRGTLAQLDGHSALLWVNGNAAEATLTGRPYLQGGKGTPRPLLLTRHVGRGPLAHPPRRFSRSAKWTGTRTRCTGACQRPSATPRYSPRSSSTKTSRQCPMTTACSCESRRTLERWSGRCPSRRSTDRARFCVRSSTAPAGPASAPARSKPRSAAGTSTPKANHAQPTASPASPPTSARNTTSPRHADGNQ